MNIGGKNIWSIILAGGEGERLRRTIQRWLGSHKPKQYCTFVGSRSMLKHTLDRASLVSDDAHKIALISRAHWEVAGPQLQDCGKVILQPANRDTASAIFLPLVYLRRKDPDALIVVFPSDHFVYPEKRFMEAVWCALAAAYQTQQLVLLGIQPDGPEPDYGWIFPKNQIGWLGGRRIRSVCSFVEKPSRKACKSAATAGALWNTLVFAVRAEILWEMGCRLVPDLMRSLSPFGQLIEPSEEEACLDRIYSTLKSQNFSSEVLQRVTQQSLVIEVNGVLWSDWGRARRIVESLEYLGRKPAFPPEVLRAAG